VDEDQALGTALRPVPGEELDAEVARMRGGLALLAQAEPELAQEIDALICEIVLVATRDEGAFDGASSFHLWGALFLNAAAHRTRIEIAEALAHESGHTLLFGISLGEPLVRNPGDARFASPLRRDRRPMDGVVHATYVLARMHRTMTRLLASNLLTDTEREEALARREMQRRGFIEGLRVVEADAVWTAPGKVAFDAASAYMREAVRG
jgi:HEXXH motif-containing protein